MGNLNKWLGIGRLGQDPEKKTTPSGKSVVNVSMAISEYYKNKEGEQQSRTEWINLVLWERQADVVAQYCHKGSQIFVEGSLQTREWQDKEGNRRFTTEIKVRNIQLLDPKPNQNAGDGQQPQSNQQSQFGGSKDNFEEDDIPF